MKRKRIFFTLTAIILLLAFLGKRLLIISIFYFNGVTVNSFSSCSDDRYIYWTNESKDEVYVRRYNVVSYQTREKRRLPRQWHRRGRSSRSTGL